ncbi:MAG: hydrogenase formation protein HypD [Rhodothermaceae bacterium]|nr:hydrogenase formation protein HypD [Rhodothermaceae bacterium]
MKHLTEYRDADLVENLLQQLRKVTTKPWNIMEVCGGQTHGLVKHGILEMLPDGITMIHGPGCPVCVTPVSHIDQAIELALEKNVILCSYGDMLRVPGSGISLLQARAKGADIRIMYSPLEAVTVARENPDREVVFFAVGFETTAPANALSVVQAKKAGLKNYSILSAHVLVPPAIEAIMLDEETRVNGFLAAGHVCTVMGLSEYYPLVETYKIPVVVTGFEPVDLLEGILMVVKQLEKGEYRLENQYKRVVWPDGNRQAVDLIHSVFEHRDREWRGIGSIPASGLFLRDEYRDYDAHVRFGPALASWASLAPSAETVECLSGDVMKGKIKPVECPHFGTACTPEHPVGAPMVSSEGACAAYYHFSSQNHYQEPK